MLYDRKRHRGGRKINGTVEQDKELVLTVADRCDSTACGAQAYVQVSGVTGELLFCAHHYNKIMSNAVGYDKMMKFAYSILDEQHLLIENRL